MPKAKTTTTTKAKSTKKQTQGAGIEQTQAQDEGARNLITFDDAAQMLGVSRRTIERLVEREQLHTFKKKFGQGRGRLPRWLDRAEVEKLGTSAEVVSE